MRNIMTPHTTDLPKGYGCNLCGYRSSTFKAVCPQCGNKEIVVLEGAKGGKVIEFVPVYFPPENLKNIGQYVSVLVQLDNGVKMFGIILDDPQKIRVGTPVVVSSFNKETKELYFNIA